MVVMVTQNTRVLWCVVDNVCVISVWPHRDDPELPESEVFQEVCYWLLLWNGAEAEVLCLWYWQQHLWPEWRWLPGRTGMYAWTGKLPPAMVLQGNYKILPASVSLCVFVRRLFLTKRWPDRCYWGTRGPQVTAQSLWVNSSVEQWK